MKFRQRAVMLPTLEIVMQSAFRRQVLRDVAPLASGAQHIHDPIEYLPDVHRTFAAAMLGGRDHGRAQGPLVIRDVAGVAKLVPVVPGAVFGRPHGAPRESVPHRIIADSMTSSPLV